jgi:signal transduction histidine kinase/CheY-like chemotaxis protein
MQSRGFDHSHLLGKTLQEVADNEVMNKWIQHFASCLQGEESATEYKFNEDHLLLRLFPLKDEDNEIQAGIAVVQNITSFMLRAGDLKKSIDEAERANQAKSDFLARVSHEIRTPLNAILGFTEQLLQTQMTRQQSEYANLIDKSSEHLLELINDVLVLSKIEARELDFEALPFKIENEVRYVHEAFLAKAKSKKLRFSYHIDQRLDMILIGDSFRLRQILMNLISNAIKFTQNGYVELKCFLKKELKKKVSIRFDVIDTGIGMDPDNLEGIFGQFQQGDATIPVKYGGSLTVSSQVNMGSTFSFVISYKKGKKTDIVHKDTGKIDKEKLKNINVLLVDDDSVNRLLGETILTKFDCNLDLAVNGREAIQKLQEKDFDIVLLDIYMPDISGMEVARYIREEMKDQQIKIVAVTAAVMKKDIQKYFEVGMDDFLVKPFREIHLFNKMCDVLEIEKREHTLPKTEIILKEEVHPKPYNLTELKRMTEGDQKLVRQMLVTFIENSENSIYILNQLLKERNWKQIKETAHKILPSYQHLEVESVVMKLIDLKTKNLIYLKYDTVKQLVNSTIEEIGKVVKELRKELD